MCTNSVYFNVLYVARLLGNVIVSVLGSVLQMSVISEAQFKVFMVFFTHR